MRLITLTSTMLLAMQVLREAIKAVPAVKYALGVGGVISAIAIGYSLFRIDLRIAVLGAFVMLVLMGALVLFARMTTLSGTRLHLPVMAFTWSVLLIFVATSISLFTSVFFRMPVDLSPWLLQKPHESRPERPEPPVRISQDQFFEAVRTGDLASVRFYLQNGGNVRANSSDYQLPVHLAKNSTNPVQVLDVLLEFNFDVNHPYAATRSVGAQENRPLYWAVQQQNRALAAELLRLKADPNFNVEIRVAGPVFHKSLLKMAQEIAQGRDARADGREILELLLKSGARLNDKELQAARLPDPTEVASRESACRNEMNRWSTVEWISQASGFRIHSQNSYTVRETILAELTSQQLLGALTGSGADRAVQLAIQKNCAQFARR